MDDFGTDRIDSRFSSCRFSPLDLESSLAPIFGGTPQLHAPRVLQADDYKRFGSANGIEWVSVQFSWVQFNISSFVSVHLSSVKSSNLLSESLSCDRAVTPRAVWNLPGLPRIACLPAATIPF